MISNDVFAIFSERRGDVDKTDAMEEAGYISKETLVDLTVISMRASDIIGSETSLSWTMLVFDPRNA